MRWFIFLVLITTLSNAEINEHKTDLYFANGIQNTLSDATNTWISLTEKLIGKNPNLQYKFLNYKLLEKKDQDDNINYIKEISATNNEPLIAYNQTISFILDVTEALFQKIDLNEMKKTDLKTAFIVTLADNYNFATNSIDNLLVDNNGTLILTEEEKKSIKKALVLAEFFDKVETIIDIVEGHDFSIQVQGYVNSIKNGHKVVVLSHSQGNLFTQKIYNTLKDTWYIKYFDGYSVASPANSVFDMSFDFDAEDMDMDNQWEVSSSQDSYLKNHNDGIRWIPSSIPVNTPTSEYTDNSLSDNFSFSKEHSMSTYLGKEYLSNIIINSLENKIKRRNISQWTWKDENISICEPQIFENNNTKEEITAINYSSNSNNKLMSFVSGMNINSVERGHSSQKMTIDSNLTKIPNPKPIDFCYYLASSHEFVNGEVIDERSLDLQIVENETYYEQLTLSFNKLYNVNFYTLWYTNEHDEQFHHNIQQSDLTYYVDKSNNNIKAKYSKIFKELGEYSNIQIRRGDSNEFSEPVEYIATSSYIDNSFEVSENSNKDLILSWNLQESVSKIKVIILDTNTKEVIQEEEFNADGISQAYFSNISSKDLNITLIKSNGLKKQELKRYYTMQDIYTTIDTDPTAYLNQDKYDLNKDYILFTYPIHQSHYSNVEKLEIIIDGEYFDTLYKSDFDTSSDIEKAGEIVINEATQAGFLFKPHSIQLIPYNKYNEKGISGNIINVNMTLLSLKPLVSKPAANYVEDTYYPEGDILTFSWYTHQNRYPDVSYIEMVVNGEVKKTLKREDMYGTSSSVDKGFKTNVSVHTDQIVELKGYDKFGVMRASRDINVTMNPRNLNPIVKLCPVKSDYENNLLVYTTLNAYPNATSVNISINGQSTIISLDTLIEGSTMGGDKAEFKIPIDANSTGVVKVIATNRYGIESAISCESTSSF